MMKFVAPITIRHFQMFFTRVITNSREQIVALNKLNTQAMKLSQATRSGVDGRRVSISFSRLCPVQESLPTWLVTAHDDGQLRHVLPTTVHSSRCLSLRPAQSDDIFVLFQRLEQCPSYGMEFACRQSLLLLWLKSFHLQRL